MESQKVANVENQSLSPQQLIAMAITKDLSVEKLQGLYELDKQYKADQARAAFVEAMAQFQSQCPVIEKTKKVMNKDGRTVRYQYAPLDVIITQIKDALAKNGLSYRWETKSENGKMKAIAIITHTQGHSEQSDFEIPIDTEGFMTAPQKVASALTFAKRYSLCNVLGISTGDEDTDATDVEKKEKNPADPKATIMMLLKQLGHTPKTKEECSDTVMKATQLTLEQKNFDEIIGRLEILVIERNEYDSQNVSE